MITEERFHIFFHDDIDGIVSAALILFSYNFRNCFYYKSYRLYPIKTSMRNDKFNILIEKTKKEYPSDIIIIVDYQYHKFANLWIDHHFNNEIGNNKISNTKIGYNPKLKSAARILYRRLQPSAKKTIGSYIINMTDMIDSAGYESINFIFSSTDPMMILKAYIEQLSIYVDSTYCRLVETLYSCHFDMDKVLFRLGLNTSIVDDLRKTALSIEKAMIINGQTSITDVKRLYEYPRYSEYLIKPDLKYCIRIVHLGGKRLQSDVGFNQWSGHTNEINIGKMLSDLDYPISGGGHHDVGGTVMLEKDLNRFIDDVCAKLNQGESMENDDIEKYGVDQKADPIEKDAQQMVKTGEAKDLNHGRKKAVSKRKDGGKSNVPSGEDKL